MIARIFSPVFTSRRPFVVLGVFAASLVFPSGAMATLYTLTTASVAKNKGFKVRLTTNQAACGYGSGTLSNVTIVLTKTSGQATETDSYGFTAPTMTCKSFVKLKGSKSLSSGTIRGTLPAGRGSINMTFHASSGKSKARGRCGGANGKKRSGTLSGSLTLKADKLGTVKLKSTRATLSSASNLCLPGTVKGYLVEGFSGPNYVAASKPSLTGSVSEEIVVSKNGNGYGFTYKYAVANEPTSDYIPSTDLSTATIKGAGGIGGSASYAGSKAPNSHGKLTGHLWVKMAALGAVRPFASAKNHAIGADQRHH